MIIGCGMVRSGTGSLAKILDGCRGLNIKHEHETHLPFKPDLEKFEKKFQLLKEIPSLGGEVAHYNLYYVDQFMEKDPTIKFVCVKRSFELVLKSIMANLSFNPYRSLEEGHEAFPKLDVEFEDAIKMHYDWYYNKAQELTNKYPNNFLIFRINEFSTSYGLGRLFDYLKIPKEDRVYDIGIKVHKTNGS